MVRMSRCSENVTDRELPERTLVVVFAASFLMMLETRFFSLLARGWEGISGSEPMSDSLLLKSGKGPFGELSESALSFNSTRVGDSLIINASVNPDSCFLIFTRCFSSTKRSHSNNLTYYNTVIRVSSRFNPSLANN
eukprot:UN28370